jgi:hypothetical protein
MDSNSIRPLILLNQNIQDKRFTLPNTSYAIYLASLSKDLYFNFFFNMLSTASFYHVEIITPRAIHKK